MWACLGWGLHTPPVASKGGDVTAVGSQIRDMHSFSIYEKSRGGAFRVSYGFSNSRAPFWLSLHLESALKDIPP